MSTFFLYVFICKREIYNKQLQKQQNSTAEAQTNKKEQMKQVQQQSNIPLWRTIES